MRYLKSEQRNGVRQKPDEVVDEDYVQNYTSKATRDWFENLGGQEEMRVRQGVIYVKSTSPDGKDVHEVVFTPQPAPAGGVG